MTRVVDDRYAVMELALALTPDDSRFDSAVLLGDPVSKARPRYTGKGRPYTPQKTIDGENALAWRLKSIPKYRSNVVVAAVFYRKTRQRIDVDNLLKTVLDAATKAGVWDDDSQVTAIAGRIEYDPINPRTVVAFANHVSTLTRGDAAAAICEACGALFSAAGGRRATARWCSIECRTVLAPLVDCAICGTPFKRKNGNQTLCSRECQLESTRRRNRERARTARASH